MESILYIQVADHGILKHVLILILYTYFIHHTKLHTNKGSVLTFAPDKLERIDRSYNAEVKIKTTIKTVVKSQDNNERGTSEMSRGYDNKVNPENDSDGSDGYDGSRGSAHDIKDNTLTVVNTSYRQVISSNTLEGSQGTIRIHESV